MGEKRLKALIIEDDLICQRAVKTLLLANDVEVITASGEQDALKLLSEPCDLILMDLGLEDTDGFSLSNKIKELGKEYCEIPIVGITANLTELYRKKAKACDMVEIIEKPLRSIDIKRIIQMYLS